MKEKFPAKKSRYILYFFIKIFLIFKLLYKYSYFFNLYFFSKSITHFILGKKIKGNLLNICPFNNPDKLLKYELFGVKQHNEQKAVKLIYFEVNERVYNISTFLEQLSLKL